MRLAQQVRAVRLAAGKRASWVVAGLAVTLAACGQKGPLYLPDKGGSIVTSPAPSGTPAAPPQSAPNPPPQSAPNPSPQSAPQQPSQTAPAPPKKTDKDNDQPTPQ